MKSPATPAERSPAAQLRGLSPEWQTIRWLQQCESEIMDNKVVWWALVDPLTDGSDAASQVPAKRLVAVWRWTFMLSEYHVCPPAPTSLNIGQFLLQGSMGTVQEWLLAYARILQHVGEVAHRRSWCCNRDNYTPQVPLLVDTFLEVTDTWLLEADIVDCWNASEGDVAVLQKWYLTWMSSQQDPQLGTLGMPWSSPCPQRVRILGTRVLYWTISPGNQ